jgi:putative Holliday junction resolvase
MRDAHAAEAHRAGAPWIGAPWTGAAASELTMTDGVVLAFDFGTRRIGVAIGNGVTRQARPLAIIEALGDARWEQLATQIAEWQPVQLVVGVARHPDGAPHEMTARCEKFARQLEGRYRLPVVRVDERYSSVAVDAGRDDQAAAVILQQWFDEDAGRSGQA